MLSLSSITSLDYTSSILLTPDTSVAVTIATKAPIFLFYSRYTGKEGLASRWLKVFEHELSEFRDADGIPSTTYLHYLDLLLLGEAAEWIKSNPEAVRLMVTLNSI